RWSASSWGWMTCRNPTTPPTRSLWRSATCRARRSAPALARKATASGKAEAKPRLRLDEALVARGLADTRSRARALILAGDVLVDGAVTTHAGTAVREDAVIALKEPPRFVSRGGEKLEHARCAF